MVLHTGAPGGNSEIGTRTMAGTPSSKLAGSQRHSAPTASAAHVQDPKPTLVPGLAAAPSNEEPDQLRWHGVLRTPNPGTGHPAARRAGATASADWTSFDTYKTTDVPSGENLELAARMFEGMGDTGASNTPPRTLPFSTPLTRRRRPTPSGGTRRAGLRPLLLCRGRRLRRSRRRGVGSGPPRHLWLRCLRLHWATPASVAAASEQALLDALRELRHQPRRRQPRRLRHQPRRPAARP